MKKTASKSAKQPPRKAPAKRMRRSGTPGDQGNLTSEETTNLVLQARDAFNLQTELGRVEPGQSFEAWRREQVQDVVGVPGISKMRRDQWKTVKRHFLILAGREAEALDLDLKTGVKTYRPTGPDDTWETCEQYAFIVRRMLTAHAEAVTVHPKGHLSEGWFLTAARQRSGKPSLNLDTLAERLDPDTLHGLLCHLSSHINLREGRDKQHLRSERVYPQKPDPGSMHEDTPF